MELPKEWNEIPEMQRHQMTQPDALINQYNWNLDPMQVGDLAALASYGVHEDPFLPELPEAQIPVFAPELMESPPPMFQPYPVTVTTDDINSYSYLNL